VRGQPGGDLIDERRDWHGEPARCESGDGQENERPEQQELLPTVDDGPRVQSESAMPQHQTLTIPSFIPF
jgi:hypothetical protein